MASRANRKGASGGGRAEDTARGRYTRPALRERIKARLKRSSKGGRAGEWSARKSQLLVQEYEKAGGGYTTARKGAAQRSLERWSAEEWQTRDGEARARDGDTTHRYLPKEAWARLTPAQRRRAEREKARASRAGAQHAPWSPATTRAVRGAKRAARRAADGSGPTKAELYARAQRLDVAGRSRMNKAQLARAVARAERG